MAAPSVSQSASSSRASSRCSVPSNVGRGARNFAAGRFSVTELPPPQICCLRNRHAPRVQNGYARLGMGGGVRPPREFRNPSVSSEKVPVRACEWTRVLHLSFPRNEGVPGSSPGVGSSRSRDAPGRFASGLAPLNVLRSSRARLGSRCTTADSVGIAGNEVGNHKGERDQKDDDEGNCGIEQRDHLPNRRFCTFPRHCHR